MAMPHDAQARHSVRPVRPPPSDGMDEPVILSSIVSDLLLDLYEDYASPKTAEWQQWRTWAVDEGLKFSRPETMDAFKAAVDQIESKLMAECPDV